MITLLVNFWGGIPGEWMQHVAAQCSSWATETRTDVVLPHLSASESAAACMGRPEDNLFRAVPNRRVVVLGARGSTDRDHLPTRTQNDHLDDPRDALRSMGVDKCSLYDTADARGRASAHDEVVLSEVLVELERAAEAGQPLFVWVNLLACRDVASMHYPSSDPPGEDECTLLRSAASADHVPASVHAVHPVARREKTRPNGVTIADEYTDRLHAAKKAVDELVATIDPVLSASLRLRAHVALTASHLLAIGEHGLYGGGTLPTSICCNTLWCSNVSLPALTGQQPLTALVAQWVTERPQPTGTHTLHTTFTWAGTRYTRLVIPVHDHQYAVLYGNRTVACVYDLSVDPDEVHDIATEVTHLHATFLKAVATLSTSPTTETTTPPSASTSLKHRASSPLAPVMPTRVRTVPRRQTRPSNVRTTETRINTKHR